MLTDGRLSKREGPEALGRDANTPPNLNRGGRLLSSVREDTVARVAMYSGVAVDHS